MIRVLLQKHRKTKSNVFQTFLTHQPFWHPSATVENRTQPSSNQLSPASPANQELGPLEQKDFQELEPNQGETCRPVKR